MSEPENHDNPTKNQTEKVTPGLSAAPVDRTVVISTRPSANARKKNSENQTTSRNLSARFSLEVFRRKNWTRTGDLAQKKEDVDEYFGRNLTQYTNMPVDSTAGAEPEAMPDLSGKYTQLEVFNEGGQGIISAARETVLGRVVALKTLKTTDNRQAASDFVAEAKVTAQLEHPSIIPIYAIGKNSEDKLQLAMKLVNGKTLRDHLKNIALNYRVRGIASFDEHASLFKRLELFLHVCDALAYAHHRRIMHCDLKPENIMIGEYMEVYLMDWGLAKPIPRSSGTTEWVRPKTIAGTPRYLSPEAAVGDPVDERSDIFALGLILQEITTLAYAVPGDDNTEIMNRIREDRLEPPVHRWGFPIDGDLIAIIRKATAFRREDRYQSVRNLADDLRAYIQGNEVSARPDNLFRKMVRWTYHHRTTMLIGVLTALAIAFGTVAFTIYRNLQQTRQISERNEMINRAFSSCFAAASMLDRTILAQEKNLSLLANLTAQRLSSGSSDGNENLFLQYDAAGRLAEPPDAVYAPAYHSKISFSHGVCKPIPSVNSRRLRLITSQLSPLVNIMRSAILSSDNDLSPSFNTSRKEQLDTAIQKGLPTKSFYIGLKEGIQLGYPWREIYREAFDPRKRPWYQRGIKSKYPVWGKPYVGSDYQVGLSLPCSMQIFDDHDRVYGVAGLDLSFKTLTSILRNMGVTGPHVLESALINAEGIIMASSVSRRKKDFSLKDSESNEEVSMKPFDRTEIRRRILSRKYGYFTAEEPGRGEMLYLFSQMKSINWICVQKIDFNAYRRHFRQRKTMETAAGLR